jgi:hypothetical protein
MARLMAGDLDAGFLYMHQALKEDQLSSGKELPQQPALFFVTMNTRRAEQAARAIVLAYAQFLRKRMTRYRRSGRGTLTWPGFRRQVIAKPALLESLFHLVYSTARIMRLGAVRIPSGTTGFGRNLYAQALSDLCLVAEDWLGSKWRGRADDMFAALAVNYAASTGLALTRTEREEVRVAASSAAAWGVTCTALLDGSFRTSSGRNFSEAEADLLLAWLVRNRSAHTVEADPLLETRFGDLEQRIFFALFRVAEYL